MKFHGLSSKISLQQPNLFLTTAQDMLPFSTIFDFKYSQSNTANYLLDTICLLNSGFEINACPRLADIATG